MNKKTVHSVKEKSMDRNAIQLNTVTKERTNEEGLMNHRKGKKKEKKGERERSLNIKACTDNEVLMLQVLVRNVVQYILFKNVEK